MQLILLRIALVSVVDGGKYCWYFCIVGSRGDKDIVFFF